jgi:acyl carrier protein
MNDMDKKLIECLQTVFPGVPDAALRQASVQTLAQWDSLATVTIVALVEEQFGIEVDPDDLTRFDSFDHIAAFLESRMTQE